MDAKYITTASGEPILSRVTMYTIASHAPKISFFFPSERLARRLDYLSTVVKWNVFIRNVEILVKPSHYLHSIFVLFLACQFSLLQWVMH